MIDKNGKKSQKKLEIFFIDNILKAQKVQQQMNQ
jgi:hypothetical protein